MKIFATAQRLTYAVDREGNGIMAQSYTTTSNTFVVNDARENLLWCVVTTHHQMMWINVGQYLS